MLRIRWDGSGGALATHRTVRAFRVPFAYLDWPPSIRFGTTGARPGWKGSVPGDVSARIAVFSPSFAGSLTSSRQVRFGLTVAAPSFILLSGLQFPPESSSTEETSTLPPAVLKVVNPST